MSDKKFDFEASMQELEQIMDKMTQETLSLDESIACYARAAELIRLCNERLAQAKIQVEEIDAKMAAFGEDDGL